MPGVNDNLQISALLLEPTAVYSPYTFFISNQFNLPFSVVDQTAGAAVRAPERSPHGLHKV